ncbi:MAG: RHS repeat-associated core domain-containing protein [Polyangiales bacterium]
MLRIRKEQFAETRRQTIERGLLRSFQGEHQLAFRDEDRGGIAVRDAYGNDIQLEFDGNGFVESVVSPMGRRWRFETDATGAVRRFSSPSNQWVEVQRDGRGNVQQVVRDGAVIARFSLDGAGNLIAVHHPDDTATSFSWAESGRLTGVADRDGTAEVLRYDGAGRLTEILDGNANCTRFVYGKWDRPEVIVRPDGAADRFFYDDTGLLRRMATAGGRKVQLTHDEAGRPTNIRYSDGQAVEFLYDSAGRMVSAATNQTTVSFQYSTDGSLVEERCGAMVTRLERDEGGALVGIVYPSGERVGFRYDADRRPDRVVDWRSGIFDVSYLDEDAGRRILGPNGVITTTLSNRDGTIASVAVASPAQPGGIGLLLRYAYDLEGRVVSCEDSRVGEVSMFYDGAERLADVRTHAADLCETYRYDRAGNRTICGSEGAAFSENNELLRQGDLVCAYDDDGNLIRMRDERGEWKYDYDGRNLLVRVTMPTGDVVSFGYDALARRIWKRFRETVTWYGWAGEVLIGEYQEGPEGVRAREFVYLPGTREVVAQRVDGLVYSVHTDRGGTPQCMCDEQGRVVWSATFSAFGVAAVQGTPSCSLRMPGQVHDEETGLYYNRFRYYIPRLGRYASRDPVSFLAGTNAYVYAHNDPRNRADPLGLWSMPSWQTCASVAGGVIAGVAVGAAIVVCAPAIAGALGVSAAVVGAAGIILGGAVGGAVGGGLNEGLNHGFCVPCIAKAMGWGALVGALASIPFLFLPEAAGVLAFAAAGGASGAIGYLSNLLFQGGEFNWADLGGAIALGAVTAGAGRYLAGKYTQWRASRTTVDQAELPTAPAREAPAGDPLEGPPAEAEANPVEPFSRSDAHDILVNSEGAPGPGTNVGHAGEHVALNGEDPAALASSTQKGDNTTWRSSSQGERDLRDVLNANRERIDALPADGHSTEGGTQRLTEQRQGFHSEDGAPANPVVFDTVTWRVCRMPDGRLHLVHFAPKP